VQSCSVTGYWERGTTNGTVTPDEFLVIPLLFHGFVISIEDPLIEVTKGESAYFNMTINNTGNIEDNFRVNITNREELESSNLNIPILPTSTLVEGGTKTFMLAVHTSSDTPVGDYQIHVNVTSVGSEGEGEEIVFEEYTLTISVTGESSVNDGTDDEGELDIIIPLILLIVVILIIIMIVILRKRTGAKGGPS
jgi:hypothetical protein